MRIKVILNLIFNIKVKKKYFLHFSIKIKKFSHPILKFKSNLLKFKNNLKFHIHMKQSLNLHLKSSIQIPSLPSIKKPLKSSKSNLLACPIHSFSQIQIKSIPCISPKSLLKPILNSSKINYPKIPKI